MLEAVQIRDPERVFALYPHEVSGGMGQRAMIAMMLVTEPDLLIADEPTSALDVTVQLEVLRILDELVTERGMGLIFISHDLKLVSSFCDRVLVMYAGQRRRGARGASDLRRGAASLHAGPDALPADARGRRSPAADPRTAIRPGRCDVALTDARDPEPPRRLRHGPPAGRCGQGRELPRGAGRRLRARRRIRLRQVDGAARHLRPRADLRRARPRRRDARSPRRATKAFYRTVQMVFQDPYGSLHPRHTVDRTLCRAARDPRREATPRRASSQALREVGPRARPSASAIRTSSRAASASASPSPAR